MPSSAELLARTRDNAQVLFNSIWQLERTRVDEAICAKVGIYFLIQVLNMSISHWYVLAASRRVDAISTRETGMSRCSLLSYRIDAQCDLCTRCYWLTVLAVARDASTHEMGAICADERHSQTREEQARL